MVTQGDVNNARGTISRLDREAQAHLAKLNGAKITTQLDAENKVLEHWWEYTWAKRALKVEGGYVRVQVGASNTKVYGLKGDCIVPFNISYTLGMEMKNVAGLVWETTEGAKSDDIGGAKVDNLLGIKLERKTVSEGKVGSGPTLRNELIFNDKMTSLKRFFGKYAAKCLKWKFKVDEVKKEIGELKEEIAKLEEGIKHMELSGTQYEGQSDSLKQDAESKAELKGGDIEYDCNGWQVQGSGSIMNLFPSSQCMIEARGGGMVVCGPSNVYAKGSTVKLGVSF